MPRWYPWKDHRWAEYRGAYPWSPKRNRLRPPSAGHGVHVLDFVEEVTGTWEPRTPAPTRGIRVYPTDVAPGIFVFEWPPADEAPVRDEAVH